MSQGVRFTFDRFELDPQRRRLFRDGETIPLPDRHFDVLHQLVSRPGATLSKDALVAAAWGDVAVTDNSLEQAISSLRRTLGSSSGVHIETVPRRGYRFTGEVTRAVARESDDALDALLAPHRAWLEGRAALESLELEQIVRAREVFDGLVRTAPDQVLPHIGLANACALQFETTRTDAVPDGAALAAAERHAREACRLDPQMGEGWATLAFVLDRRGNRRDALAAIRRAVTLEPDNWRHHFRAAYVSWGEERLRAARRTLALLPGFPLAHWMVATVLVARNVLDEAERELDAGAAVQDRQGEHSRFSAVALHWLRGLIRLARGDERGALEAFERELSFESAGHLYGRECCAQSWYAIGAVRLRRGQLADARRAFERAVERVAAHPPARIALAACDSSGTSLDRAMAALARTPASGPAGVDEAMWQAIGLVLRGDHAAAARLVDQAFADAEPGSAGWILPVEPLLAVSARRATWEAPLARLRSRSA